MNNKYLLQQLIVEEVKKILLEQEAPPDAAFGQYLFAPLRKDTPPEPDTTKEENFLQALWDYIANERSISLEDMMPFLLSIKNEGYYNKFLEPPAVEVYRYMTVKRSVAKSILNLSDNEITKHSNRAWWVDNVGTLHPKGKQMMSWTVNPNSSGFDDFIQPTHDNVALLLVANTKNNNFLLNPKTFIEKFTKKGKRKREISTMLDLLKQEMETISYGPVNVVGASFLYVDVDDVYKRKVQAIEQKVDQVKLPDEIANKVDQILSAVESSMTDDDAIDDAVVVIIGQMRDLMHQDVSVDAMVKHIENVFSPIKSDSYYVPIKHLTKKLISLLVREYIQEKHSSSSIATEFIKIWKPAGMKKTLLKELFLGLGRDEHFRKLPILYRSKIRKALIMGATKK